MDKETWGKSRIGMENLRVKAVYSKHGSKVITSDIEGTVVTVLF